MDPASVKEEQPAGPKRCSNSCGFFANPNCGDMCSKCSREVQASQAQAVKAIAATAPPPQPLHHQQISQHQLQQQETAAVSPVSAATESAAVSLVSPTNGAHQQTSFSEAAGPEAEGAAAAASETKTAAVSLAAPQPSTVEVADEGSTAATSAAAPEEDDGEAEPPRRIQKHSNRCFSCSKKVGLTGFKCRCGYVFCGPHRLAEAHDCDYDYKGNGREHLAKVNPLIQADRVQRF